MTDERGRNEPEAARYGADDGPVSLWSPGTPLPVYAELEGRSVALVDGGEYRALLAMREAVTQAGGATAETGATGDDMSSQSVLLDRVKPVSLPAGVLGNPSRPLPALACLEGRIVVIAELADYREYLSATAQRLQGIASLAAIERRVGRAARAERADKVGYTTIDRDPEVAAFLRERFPRRETIATLHATCLEQFGPERTPSAGRIQNFRSKWRRR